MTGPASSAGRHEAPGRFRRGRRLVPWGVLLLWVAALAALFPLASKLSSATSNDATAWLPDNAEATQAYHRALDSFPGADRLVAVVVYEHPGGLGPADQAKVAADRAAFQSLAPHGEVSPPIPSADGAAVLLSFPLSGDEAAQSTAVRSIRQRIDRDLPAGSRAALTGPAGAVADITDAFDGLDSTLILVTAGVVAILLLLTYRSPVLWLIPLISVGVASQLASAVVYLLARHAGVTVNGQSQGILTVLVFGAGTDYALLLISRYREELHRHADRYAAMAVALRRSLPAILASAATVAIGLLCLLGAQLNNISGLGPVGAVGIASAFAVLVTLLPALLVICGRWLFWPFVPRFSARAGARDVTAEHGVWGRVARLVGRRPGPVWLTTAVVLGALAVGLLGVQHGMTAADQYTKPVGSVTGQRIVQAHFPGGASEPADIYARAGAAGQVAAAAQVPGVQRVAEPDVAVDGQWVHIAAVLSDPPDSAAARDTVRRLRTAVHAVPGADALVGGQTASQVDIDAAASHDNRTVLPLILAVVFVVLALLLRALVAPLVLIASVVLSFAAALGAATLIFHAIGHPRTDQGLPLLAFLFLVALGVDYTIFLMTRAREETARFGTRIGVTRALAVTGGVITSAGLVLAATFAVLAVLPLTMMLQMGIVVALGVLLDTLVVRTLLVPALAVRIGRRIWLPGRLARKSTVDEPVSGVVQAAAGSGSAAPRQSAVTG